MTIYEWDKKNENKIKKKTSVKTRTDFFQRAWSSVIAQLTFEDEKYDLSLLNAMDQTTA